MPSGQPWCAKVLVTGDQGFVGAHALARWPTAIGLSSLASSINIYNKESLLDCFGRFLPDTVLHLAALSFVPDSFKAPEETFEVNFLGSTSAGR